MASRPYMANIRCFWKHYEYFIFYVFSMRRCQCQLMKVILLITRNSHKIVTTFFFTITTKVVSSYRSQYAGWDTINTRLWANETFAIDGCEYYSHLYPYNILFIELIWFQFSPEILSIATSDLRIHMFNKFSILMGLRSGVGPCARCGRV